MLNYDVFFLRNTNFPLMALVFRKVESRTTDKFKQGHISADGRDRGSSKEYL